MLRMQRAVSESWRRVASLGSVAAIILGLAGPTPVAAQVAQTAQVTMTATGFQPSSVTIAVNGSVIWTISTGDNKPHSVVDPGGAFDSGPLNNGQQFVHQFVAAGTYTYSSWFDCHDDAAGWRTSNGNFACQATVNVVNAPAAPSPVPAPVVAPPPAPAPCQFVLGFAALANAVPQVGQCRDNEHPDPSGNGNEVQNSSGGLLVWRKIDNWTAFTNGYMTWVNGPNGIQSRLNTDRFPWEHEPITAPTPIPAATPAPAVPTASASPTPVATPTAPNVITFTEENGFLPNPLVIHAGSTVTWVNNGTSVHSIVQDGGGFDSGGLAPGQNYSYTFPGAGTFTYHSSTEQIYTTDSNGNTVVSYKYTGTVTVQ